MRALMLAVTLIALVLAAAPFAVRAEIPGLRADRLRGRLLLLLLVPRRIAYQVRLRFLVYRVTGDVGALFFRRGKSTIIWAPTVADPSAPTVSEVTAGVVMDAAIAGMSGWETTLNRVNQEVWKYETDYQIDGPQQLGDAQMTLLDDDGGSDTDEVARAAVDTAMVEQDTGYMIFFPKTTVVAAAAVCHVFPARIGARNDDLSLTAQAARYTVDFAIVGNPQKSVAVAA